tara:strand:+ start:25534 stop:26124 length:591 start_codon:yes stop_codon:yes gene_type:complete
MNREELFKNHILEKLYNELNEIHNKLNDEFSNKYERTLPFNEELFDRWEKAKKLNFGNGSSIYDSSLVFGKPKIGKDVWIGPYTIIDASGGLRIGNNVTISVGVQVYTHDNIKRTLIGKKIDIDLDSVSIGNNSYIGPNTIIAKGNDIGNRCVVGANSFINNSFPDNSIIAGNPAKKIGEINIKNEEVEFNYFNIK